MKKSWFTTFAAVMLTAASLTAMPAFAEESSTQEPLEESSAISDEMVEELIDSYTNEENSEESSNLEESSAIDYYEDDYYDTEGNASLIENQSIIYNSDEMQFISVTTKDGNVFYILIDYTAASENGGENVVYFLNKVDDYDLYSLLYADDSSDGSALENYENQNYAASGSSASGNNAKNTDASEENNNADTTTTVSGTATQKRSGNSNMLLLIGGVVVIGAAAAFYFLKIRPGKKKNSAVQDDDLDFDEYDDSDEEM